MFEHKKLTATVGQPSNGSASVLLDKVSVRDISSCLKYGFKLHKFSFV